MLLYQVSAVVKPSDKPLQIFKLGDFVVDDFSSETKILHVCLDDGFVLIFAIAVEIEVNQLLRSMYFGTNSVSEPIILIIMRLYCRLKNSYTRSINKIEYT